MAHKKTNYMANTTYGLASVARENIVIDHGAATD